MDLAESFDELCSDSDLHLIVSGFGSDFESHFSVFLRFIRFNSSSSMLKSRFEIVDSIEEKNFTIYLRFSLSNLIWVFLNFFFFFCISRNGLYMT